jgi:ribosomal protein L16/L10AE
MLLRPRKVNFKSTHKKRSLNTIKLTYTPSSLFFKKKNLIYGQSGLLNKNPNFFIYNKHLFKIKLFLKKAVRRSTVTNRHLWFKVFPHIPVTKKVIGSRMGKGKGKPSD